MAGDSNDPTKVPGLPQRNSNAADPGPFQVVKAWNDQVERTVFRGAPPSPPQPALSLREELTRNVEADEARQREAAQSSIAAAPERSPDDLGGGLPPPPVPGGGTPPEGGALPTTWKQAIPYVVWVVLILGFGLELVAALVRGEAIHAVVSFFGLVGLMAAALHWNQIKSWAARTNPNWVIATLSLVLAGLILSPFLEQNRRWPFVGPTTESGGPVIIHGAPTAEEIAKATAPLQSRLDEAIRQRDAAQADLTRLRQQPTIQASPPYAKKMGPIYTLNAFSQTGAIWRELVPKNQAILFTASPDNKELWLDLHRIFEVGMREVQSQMTPGKSPLLQLPNYQRDIDAPSLAATNISGIIIHGAVPDDLRAFFERCFVTRWTEKVPDGLTEYYKFQHVIWIEIGNGFPWKGPTECSE
jgi:hypothetical protein